MIKKSQVIASAAVPVFSIVAVLIYGLVPVSDIANGIEHSGKDAIYLLALSPLFALLAFINFCAIYKMERNYWTGIYKNNIVNIVSAVLAVGLCFTFASASALTLYSLDLGFVAPFSGTVYDSLFKAMIVITVVILSFYITKLILYFKKQK